jgi:hypothetical protein
MRSLPLAPLALPQPALAGDRRVSPRVGEGEGVLSPEARGCSISVEQRRNAREAALLRVAAKAAAERAAALAAARAEDEDVGMSLAEAARKVPAALTPQLPALPRCLALLLTGPFQ